MRSGVERRFLARGLKGMYDGKNLLVQICLLDGRTHCDSMSLVRFGSQSGSVRLMRFLFVMNYIIDERSLVIGRG